MAFSKKLLLVAVIVSILGATSANFYQKGESQAQGGLLIYYKMNELSGTTVTDGSGFGFNGLNVGGTVNQPGVYNKSYSMNTNYIRTESAYTISNAAMSHGYSYGAWIKSSYSTTHQGILDFTNISANVGTSLLLLNGAYPRCRMVNTTGGAQVAIYNVDERNGLWHQLYCTYNSTDLTVYVDGAYANNTKTSGTMIWDRMNMSVGTGNGIPGSWYLNGSIDEVMLWNKTLSVSDILGLYQMSQAEMQVTSNPANDTVTDVTAPYNVTTAFRIATADGLLNMTYTLNGTANSILDSNTIFWYEFDNTTSIGESNSVVRDMSHSKNDAYFMGGASTTSSGFRNGGVVLDSTTGALYIPRSSSTLGVHDATALSWGSCFKVNADSGGYSQTLIEMLNATSGKLIDLEVLSSGALRCLYSNDTANNGVTSSSTAFIDNNWHCAMCTLSPTTLNLYVDGALTDTTTTSGAIHTTINDNITLGCGNGCSYFTGAVRRWVNGSIDEAKMFKKTLTDPEVSINHWSFIHSYNQTHMDLNTTQPMPIGSSYYTLNAWGGSGYYSQASANINITLTGTGPAPTCTSPTANQNWAITLAYNCTFTGLNLKVANITVDNSNPGYFILNSSNISCMKFNGVTNGWWSLQNGKLAVGVT